MARKVDFGEGRSRFEPSYGHPRHFHLICNTCHRSSEFLSSDVETLVEEVAAARGFTPEKTVVQIFGMCEECRTGAGRTKTGAMDGATTELVFARDALRIAIATEKSGLSSMPERRVLRRIPAAGPSFRSWQRKNASIWASSSGAIVN